MEEAFLCSHDKFFVNGFFPKSGTPLNGTSELFLLFFIGLTTYLRLLIVFMNSVLLVFFSFCLVNQNCVRYFILKKQHKYTSAIFFSTQTFWARWIAEEVELWTHQVDEEVVELTGHGLRELDAPLLKAPPLFLNACHLLESCQQTKSKERERFRDLGRISVLHMTRADFHHYL